MVETLQRVLLEPVFNGQTDRTCAGMAPGGTDQVVALYAAHDSQQAVKGALDDLYGTVFHHIIDPDII